MSQSERRAELIDAGRRLDSRGWVPGGGGNFSCRLDAERILVTASGRHKGRLGEADFLLIDREGQPLEAGRKPSAEALLHCERYAATDAACVLHTHSVTATVISRATRGDQIRLQGYEMQKALGGVSSHEASVSLPVFANDQDITRLSAQVARRHAEQPIEHGYIIRGHGLYAWADSVETALHRIEALEFLLQCHLLEQLRDDNAQRID